MHVDGVAPVRKQRQRKLTIRIVRVALTFHPLPTRLLQLEASDPRLSAAKQIYAGPEIPRTSPRPRFTEIRLLTTTPCGIQGERCFSQLSDWIARYGLW
jgi:hypothetical protein